MRLHVGLENDLPTSRTPPANLLQSKLKADVDKVGTKRLIARQSNALDADRKNTRAEMNVNLAVLVERPLIIIKGFLQIISQKD